MQYSLIIEGIIFLIIFIFLLYILYKQYKKSKNQENTKKLSVAKYVIGTLFIMLTTALIVLIWYVYDTYYVLDFNMIIYYLSNSLGGANMKNFSGVAIAMVLISIIIGAYVCALMRYGNFKGKLKLGTNKHYIKELGFDDLRMHYIQFSLSLFFIVALIALYVCGFFTFVKCRLSDSHLLEDYYVYADDVMIEFPEEKRNLIYIYMESMENTYTTVENGGNFENNLIEEMVCLQQENINFSNDSNLINGAYASYGATWTIAAMVSQTSGTPLLIPVRSDGEKLISRLNVDSIGEILEENGYTNEILLGSTASFSNRDIYFTNHGNYMIKDFNYAKENEWIPSDYFVFWGYEDQKLYEYAKNELLELAEEDAPFNFTMLTVDTHYTDGYYCELCEDEYGDQYSNVISCASRQVTDFISWIEEQDFYENTTIIICGDHPTMNNEYVDENDVNEDYIRKTYTCVINSAVTYDLDYTRTFSTYDMFPTTLAALGVEIEGNRLGLGTNLFSDTPTLAEIYGYDYVDEELSYDSDYYYDYILSE